MSQQTTALQPYDTVADAYDRMGELVTGSWGEKHHHEKAAFLAALWEGGDVPVDTVLELACGTGLMLRELADLGYEVTGLDRSPAMLERARARLGAEVPLVCAALPEVPVERCFDAVISAGESLNYLTGAELATTFQAVAAVLRPGGSFVFDVRAAGVMTDQAGPATLACDLGDVAFIMAYSNSPEGDRCDVTWTQFVRTGPEPTDPYARTVEHHRLYPLTQEVIREAARGTGLVEQGVYDNYALTPADGSTLTQTWTFRRADA
ncbi:class I SAM-dependent DNA methyltransferase [Actinacidiphila yeochonensis]|uniref:class I SAM-dependent DNA methyltransferase n=1 Tax=Actinacidiphila yeochonensis TaxID=89050 RepID=UPI000562D5A9|nr:class I SAM-dependent methyltransferase [Actinacidiphila yeochonensis]